MIGEKTREIIQNLDFDELIELYFNERNYEDIVNERHGNDSTDERNKTDQKQKMR